MFRLTFLGTSAGKPTPSRNVSGLAIECSQGSKKSGDWLLIDCGEATQHRLWQTPLKLSNLKAILITHLHGDHCFGLPPLLSSLSMQKRTQPLTIIAPQALTKLLDTYSLVSELYFSYPIEFVATETMDTHRLTLDKATLDIKAVALSHRIASYGFALTATTYLPQVDSQKLAHLPKDTWRCAIKADPSLLTQTKKQQKLVVAGDNDTPSLLSDFVQEADALVHECTYTQSIQDKNLAKGINFMHTSADTIGRFAAMMDLPCLILTHFSARFATFDNPTSHTPNMGHIRTEVQEHYQGRLVLVQDLMQIVL